MKFHKISKDLISYAETITLNNDFALKRDLKHSTSLNEDHFYKYSDVWQRVFAKIRVKLFLSKITKGALKIEDRMNSFDKNFKDNIEKKCFIVEPESRFKSFWNIVMVLVLLDTGIIMPFTTAFLESSGIGIIELKEVVVDFVFIFDFILNFLTAYYEQDTLIVSFKKILTSYFKSGLILDLFCSIPFSLILILINEPIFHKSKMIELMRLPRLYNLLRFSRLFKLIKFLRKVNIFQKFEEFLSIRQSVATLVSTITTIFIAMHIMACFWYFSCKFDEYSPNTWVVRYNMQDNDTITLYITSFYWVILSLSTVGYGDLSAFTILEKILSIVWIGLSLYFYAFTIGSLSSLVLMSKTHVHAYSYKLSKIDEISGMLKLPKEIIHKIKRALKSSSDISGFSWKDKEKLLNELPKKLRYKIAAVMYGGVGKKLLFFKGKDMGLMTKIMPLLTPYIINSNENIYEKGDRSDEIYFIIRGSALLYYEDKPVLKIKSFEYFGDIEIIYKIPRKYRAFTSNYLEILGLNRSIVRKLKQDDYFTWDEIRNNAILKEEIIVKRFKNIEKIKEIRGVKKIYIKDLIRKCEYLETIGQRFFDSIEEIKNLVYYKEGRLRSRSL